LDLRSGVPIYRQIMDQVVGAIATGALAVGDQLPTVRQLAVDLAINPNTVIRAYRELELQGTLETQQGTGTFISHQKTNLNGGERQRRVSQLAGEFELTIRPYHGVGINGKIDCQLTNRGKLIAHGKRPSRDSAHHLVHDLAVNRDAAAQIQGEWARASSLGSVGHPRDIVY
jgi:GntR family transcriptional regulator